jgi:eukaryotic-like serine/threonine-protein kinase
MKQRTLGNYVILEEMNRGGMAVVYKGYQPSLKRSVAIKVLSKELVTDETHLNRFHTEALLTAHLVHPGIVHLYDAGSAGDEHFLVMEFVDGADLKGIIESHGALPIPAATFIARKVADALRFAQRRIFCIEISKRPTFS